MPDGFVLGVPISTQWGAHGYYYPIQIAQYGLSHFSKFLTEKPQSSVVVEDAEDDSAADLWSVVGQRGTVNRVIDTDRNTYVIEFETSGWYEIVRSFVNIKNLLTKHFFIGLTPMHPPPQTRTSGCTVHALPVQGKERSLLQN